jgi:hypothetical protein
VHENIKTDRDIVALYSVPGQRLDKISEASPMGIAMSVDYSKCIATTGRQQKIVTSYGVFRHTKHNIAPI